MMTDLPFVSICLLTWNRSNVLPRSLDTLLRQTYSNFEIIINDDCSTDNTREVGEAYAQRDSRVKYYLNPTNLRYCGNSNIAVERSTGKYVLFAHDGDCYHPQLVEKWVAALEAHPSAALAFCGLNIMNDEGQVVRSSVGAYDEFINGQELLREMLGKFDSPIFGIVMVRRSCLTSVGNFDVRFPRITDVDMWLRLLAKFDSVYIRTPLVDVMPREKGHENSEVNWKIMREICEIRRINIERNFPQNEPVGSQLLRNYRKDRRKFYIRSIVWCFYHGRIASALAGLKEFFAWRQ